MAEYRCFTCEGSFEANVKDPMNPDADDFQAVADASHAHMASHPDELKIGMGTEPARSRDWAGRAKAARGEQVRRRG